MKTNLDRGGTFTDVVYFRDDQTLRIAKIPSDRALAGDLAQGSLTFGTTVATNALLENRHCKTLLIVTNGFTDLSQIGDMTRPALFEPERVWPPVFAEQILSIKGRLDQHGKEIEPLEIPELDTSPFDAVAIALLHSPANPIHELTLAEHLRQRHPNLFISLGHQQSPGAGYLARIQTTLVDAAITPILKRALNRDRLPKNSLAIRSDGGLCPPQAFHAPDAVLSGPAGGVLAVRAIAKQAGFKRAVGLDMGGTSTDVCRVEQDKTIRVEGGFRVGGIKICRAALEVETIAAGGGSILKANGLQLKVGPESAGADPGPQCYGRGGPPTITDAALAIGRIRAADFNPPLDPKCIQLPGDANDFLAVAHETMAGAIRKIATARGIDLRDHALIAYGGAAGQHAAEVAERVGISTVLVHPCAAVLSAWGQQFAAQEAHRVQALWVPLMGDTHRFQQVWARLDETLPDYSEVEYALDLRYRGTDQAIRLETPWDISVDDLALRFENEHRRRYGFGFNADNIEVVQAICTRRVPLSHTTFETEHPWTLPQQKVNGPNTVFLPTTSVFIPEGWAARICDGLLRLDHHRTLARPSQQQRTPLQATLWANRFMSVAEQAGERLARTARSVNIRERRDFSCAIFDESGRLVANAPHIPVHLGAMGETVRNLIAHTPNALLDGTRSWLTNAPSAGGSHLPDLTVITPVPLGATRVFVASRAHHVDVGGLTPGSMPSHSRCLADEGLVFIRQQLTEQGQLLDLQDILKGSRAPKTVMADLRAQLASNRKAAEGLQSLGSPELILTWMKHLQDLSAEAAIRVIEKLEDGSATDILDGQPISIRLSKVNRGLHVHFDVPLVPHRGNLNAPVAVVRAAVLYGLRVLAGSDLPLNDGALRHVSIHTPRNSMLHPPADAAVAGGNVETSQRLVDLFLAAAQRLAFSPGTMNNLTVGGEDWAYYETIGGGQGASATSEGASGRQCHMTNTSATDPEILERRLPLRVWTMALRKGSGGSGHHRGGDGIIRELEVLKPATASLLAAWRPHGATGLHGAGAGQSGQATLVLSGEVTRWLGQPTALNAGDRIHIETPGGGGWNKNS